MSETAADQATIAETVVFLSHFKDLPDPRQAAKVLYKLDELLLLCLLAVLGGAEAITEIVRFGEKKLDLLRRFRPFVHGVPCHDQLGTILATLDAVAFQHCFVAWVAAIAGLSPDAIAIDGKTSRRSGKGKKTGTASHIVTAFAARRRLVLGQVKVADKSNEIVAIPKLLDMLAIEGAVVTIDAMGCQRAIAQQIVDKKADYILALKGNQGTLCTDAELFVAEQKANDFRDTTITRHREIDGDHGRIETRTTAVLHDIAWLKKRHDWPGLASLVMVESVREIAGKTETETRLYIASLTVFAAIMAGFVRGHWAIENSLHWVLDMNFREDECRVRTDHAPANLATIRHMACNLLRNVPGKDSMRLRRKTAGWDDDFLARVVSR